MKGQERMWQDVEACAMGQACAVGASKSTLCARHAAAALCLMLPLLRALILRQLMPPPPRRLKVAATPLRRTPLSRCRQRCLLLFVYYVYYFVAYAMPCRLRQRYALRRSS